MWAVLLVVALYLGVVGLGALFLALTGRTTPEDAFWRASGLPRLLPWLRSTTLRGIAAAQEYAAARREARRARAEREAEARQLSAEQERKRVALQATLVHRSVNAGDALPEGYRIQGADRVRENAVDPLIKRRYRAVILGVFCNRCAACGAQTDIDLDHCWWPKVRGGNFAMRHDSGAVANVVPLCRGCNASKRDKSANAFFAPEQIVTRIAELTARFREDSELLARLY